jgi:hypothetical protein
MGMVAAGVSYVNLLTSGYICTLHVCSLNNLFVPMSGTLASGRNLTYEICTLFYVNPGSGVFRFVCCY